MKNKGTMYPSAYVATLKKVI